MFKFALLTLALLLLQGASADLEEVPSADETIYDSYRLPTAITPENYRLEVVTHLNDTEGFVFRGIVWITVRTVKIFCVGSQHLVVLAQTTLTCITTVSVSPKVTATLFSDKPKN